MRKLWAAIALIALLASFCGVAAVAQEQDTSVEGWYRVYSITPEDHDYSYIYSEPSSSKGKNLGRVDDGEYVYVYYRTMGKGKKSSRWAWCEYADIEGYIRFENLIYDPTEDGTVEGWYTVYSVVPENHDYSYIYSEPSSTQGENLCRVDDGESVYVYSLETGTGKKDSVWAYCEYDGVQGYIRYDNIYHEGE